MEIQDSEKPTTILKKKNTVGGLSTSRFQNLPQSYNDPDSVAQASGQTYISMNSTESPDINPYIYVITNFNKGAKTIQCKKNSLSKTGAGTTR